MKNFTKTILTSLVLMFALTSVGWGQTTVFSDDFSTNTSATYTSSAGVISSSAFNLSLSGVDWGARRNTSPLQLELTNDASGTTNLAGWAYAYTALSGFTSPYNATLSSNTGVLSWTFNMRTNRTSALAGFTGTTSYGAAMVLVSTSPAMNNTGNGYAVVMGGGGNNTIALISFSNGLLGTKTTIIGFGGAPAALTNYISVKVTYDPSTSQWQLFSRDDGASAFSDPSTGTLNQIGTATINSTYTSVAMSYLGAYWQGSTSSSQTTFWDNFKVTVVTPPTIQASNITFSGIGQTAMTANWTNGNGAKRIVIMNTANSFTNPTDGTDPTPNTVYSGSGEQVVFNGTTNTVSVTGLTPATDYYFRVYEYNGSGTGTKYLITTGTDNPKSQKTSAGGTPSISVTSSLTGFTTILGSSSTAQTYTVSGSDLTADLAINAPTGFQIREQGSGSYGSSLSFTPEFGTVSEKTIEVVYNPTSGVSHSGNIVHSSTGAENVNTAVSGTASATYYFSGTGNITDKTKWGTNTDGTGIQPLDYTSNNQVFNLRNTSSVTLDADLTISGTGSKLTIGDGTNASAFTIPSGFAFTGTIDANALSSLYLQNAASPTLGTLNSSSTVTYEYSGTSNVQQISYGNLILKNGTKAFLGNTTTVSGNLTFDNVMINAPGVSPFATISLVGNLTYTGTVTSPADANSITLVCTSNGTQTITGNGNTVRFFRIQTTGTTTDVVLSTTGGTTNALLGNLSGGGLNLGAGTNLTVNSNTITFLDGGKATFLGTGTLNCDGTSNLVLNSVQTTSLGTMYFNPTGNAINNLTINETNATSSFTLGSNLTINGTLTLTSGSLATGTNTLFFGTGAGNPVEATGKTIIGTATMNARSVGTGSINFLSVNVAGGTDNLGNVTITRKTGTAGVVTVGSFTSIACNWTITADNQPTNGRDVTYSWLSDFDNGKVFNSTNRGQVWISDDGNTWITSGLPVEVSGDPRSITNTVNHFSYWVVSPEDSPMPVALSSFNSVVSSRSIKLNWVTESEVNNAGFEVQRKSSEQGTVNGEQWQNVGYVKGAGNSNTATSYTFEDRNLNTGKYMYRLKQTDVNGNYEYFELNGEVEIGVPKKYDVSQNYPNPFNPVTKINFDLPENGLVNIRLFDMLGREVAVIVNEVRNAGYHTVQFDASKLSSGIYFYKMNAGKFSGVKKMAVLK